jgi:hypothetical protein
MAMILILAGLAIAGSVATRLVARAVDAEHLLVLRAEGGGVWLFERDGDRRYHRLPWTGLPAALCRFACGVPAVVRARGDA